MQFELRPLRGELAERYRAEGAWDDRSLGQFLSDALLEDRTRRFRIWSSTNPYLGTVGDVYDEALRVAGGLRALGLGPATPSPSSCPTGWRRPSPSTPVPCSA